MNVPTKRIISLQVNGRKFEEAVDENLLLIEYLRQYRKLTGAKIGCDGGECGACLVLVDGRARISCLALVISCNNKSIETIEGQTNAGSLSPLQRAFHENLGTQCGFCTPGMIMASQALLRQNPNPDDNQIKAALAGNLCRCTGYVKIIKSVRAASRATP